MHRGPDDQRRWLSLDVDGSETWLFDTEFLLSNYHCIYGNGCRSIEPSPDEVKGCCSHGAHFVDGKDRRRVQKLAEQLEPSEWQYRSRALERGGPIKKKRGGEWATRKADGACIFLNREGFEAGPGCALHVGALNRGERPVDWKPTVCWQLPLRLDVHTDDYGYETVLVRAWERRDWGPGGEAFNWWCTEQTDDGIAFSADAPLYVTAAEELTELLGEELYLRLVSELDRIATETPVTLGATRR